MPAWSPRSSGRLGDIMGGSSATRNNSSLPPLDEFTPLQRVILSANGNLQRLVSSYHDSPVTVHTVYSRGIGAGRYERQVDLCIFGTAFARATSTVSLDREDCVRAIEDEGVAIGQLFRRFNILPEYELEAAGFRLHGSCSSAATPLDVHAHDQSSASPAAADGVSALVAGRDPEGLFAPADRQFWRRYTLSGEGIVCHIHEDIRCDVFELTPSAPSQRPPSSAQGEDAAEDAPSTSGAGLIELAPTPPSLGDIMAPATTFARLPKGFTPLQRLLLTANGNVERIVSSYHGQPAQIYVSLNHRRGSIHDRVVTLMLGGRQLMLAKSTCCLVDEEWVRVMEAEKLSVGALFRRFNVMPTFTLHAAGLLPGGAFWRQYELRTLGLTCQIHETFEACCLSHDDDDSIGSEAAESAHEHQHAYGI